MAIKGLAQAMKNLDAIDRRAVPRASATTLNRVAGPSLRKRPLQLPGAGRSPPSYPCPHPVKSGTTG